MSNLLQVKNESFTADDFWLYMLI